MPTNARTLAVCILSFCLLAADDEGCDAKPPQTGRSTMTEMEQTETNQQRLAHAIPPPQLQDSQERRNLVRRLNLVNNAGRTSYIYLLSADGRIVFYSTVRGKVSSLNSLLTTPDQVVTLPCYNGSAHSDCQHVIHSPDFDGTYGENPHGVFWFTEDDTYMEWNGIYFVTDRPTRLSQEPMMVMQLTAPAAAAPAPAPVPTAQADAAVPAAPTAPATR